MIRLALFAVVAFIFVLIFGGSPQLADDIGAKQLRDAQAHAKRDAEERRIAEALREGRKQ